MKYLEAKYIHFKYENKVKEEETAKSLVQLLESMIDSLSKTHVLYIRKKPIYFKDREFDSNQDYYSVYARVSFTSPEIAGREVGVIPRVIPDDVNVCSFGLPSHG